MIGSSRPYIVQLAAVLLACGACASPDDVRDPWTDGDAAAHDAVAWTQVHATDALTIGIDTASAVAWFNGTFAVAVRTVHVVPRYHQGRAWDREIAMVQLRCDHPATRTRSVRLSVGDAPPIVKQDESLHDIDQQPWRVAEAGSGEAQAVEAACALLRTKAVTKSASGGELIWPDGQSRSGRPRRPRVF